MTLWVVVSIAALAAAFLLVPRLLLRRAQDRLAREKIERESASWDLLTRADLVVSRYRRLPGLLGLRGGAVAFEGLFGEKVDVPTSDIRKIVTGSRLASGRTLLRLETLRITPINGNEIEFVLNRPAASAWRSHLGLWAARERQADADRVTPGRG